MQHLCAQPGEIGGADARDDLAKFGVLLKDRRAAEGDHAPHRIARRDTRGRGHGGATRAKQGGVGDTDEVRTRHGDLRPPEKGEGLSLIHI